MAEQSRIARTRHVFSMTCGVVVNIKAGATTVWGILTDAQGFPRRNSTVTRIDGQIREGQRLRIHVPGTDRILLRGSQES